jgi:6-phosphogluconolactonase (cycloisomerase 2 family)
MTNRAALLISWLAPVALAAACQANSDDSASSAGSSSGGAAASAGAAGHSGNGSGTATAGASTATAGASNAQAGAGGRGGAVGLAGAAGDLGRSEAGAGAANGGDAGAGNAGNEAGAANGGEAGATNQGPPEYAYLSTYLGGIFAFSIDRDRGTPSLLPGSPIDVGALLYAESVDPAQHLLYVVDQAHKLDAFRLNADGTLPTTPAFSTAIIGNPVTLALDPAGHFAYVGTQSDAQTIIQIFQIDPTTGELSSAGDPLALSGAPAYVAVDPTGHFAYVTQAASGGIWGYQIEPTTGALSKIDGSPFGAALVFRGAIAFEPGGGFLFTSSGGLNAFSIDAASGKLELVEGSPFSPDVGSDPSATNLAIEPSGRFLYATEFAGVSTRLFGFSIAANGKLAAMDGLPLAASMPYSVGVEPSGHFLYVGRDDGQLAAFSLNLANGKLREIEGSPFPHGGPQPEFAFATGH